MKKKKIKILKVHKLFLKKIIHFHHDRSLRLSTLPRNKVNKQGTFRKKRKFVVLSSLHNIIFNAFCLIFVLWSLFQTNRALSLIRHSCSKKVLVEMESVHCMGGAYFPRTLSSNKDYLAILPKA